MVIVISDHCIKYHSPEHLTLFGWQQMQLFHYLKCLLIRVCQWIIVVQMRKSTQGLRMNFFPVHSIETPGHKMRHITVLQQTAFIHDNTGSPGHQIVGILNPSVRFSIFD